MVWWHAAYKVFRANEVEKAVPLVEEVVVIGIVVCEFLGLDVDVAGVVRCVAWSGASGLSDGQAYHGCGVGM